MMDVFDNLFWQTVKTKFEGRFVGEDEFGNKYYEKRLLFGKSANPQRRWVIYKDGGVEASNVPARWFSWLHYASECPIDTTHEPSWVRPHKHNLTGTKRRYAPTNSLLKENPKAREKKAYQPWKP